MKPFTLLTITSLLGTSLSASVLPASALAHALKPRDDCTTAFPAETYTSIAALVQNLQTTTDAFNTSVAATHAASSGNALTATAGYEAAVLSLTTAFTTTTAEIEALTGVAADDVSSACLSLTKRGEGLVLERQTATNATEVEAEIEAAVAAIIAEITAGIDTIKADLGLGKSVVA